jgi:hypothetical protein
MPRETLLTPEGLEDLKAKIDHLSTVRRREVADRIKEAREFGDISENSEYDDAKNEQAMLEKQISDLTDKLRNARVIDATEVSTEAVTVGVTVHLKDRRIRRGRPVRPEAVQRVAGRKGPDGPQARGDRVRRRPARTRPQAEDHEDRSGLVAH